MKKLFKLLGIVLTISVLCGSFCMAEPAEDINPAYARVLADNEYYTIPDWNIMIMQPEEALCVDESDGFYIYAAEEGYIPFVMVTIYDAYESEEEFYGEFTPYLEELYDDLEITDEIPELDINGSLYYETDYAYTVDDVLVSNRCIVKVFNGLTYMFTSKEVPELDLTVGTMLDDVVAGSYFLADSQPVMPGAIELDWNSIGEYAETEGSFVQLPEAGFEMLVPDSFEEYDLTAEDEENFFVYIAGQDDWTVTTQIVPVTDDFIIYDYLDYLEAEEDTDYFDIYVINGRLFIKYEIPESDMICFSTLNPEIGIVEFSYWPISDDAMWNNIVDMVSSIMPLED